MEGKKVAKGGMEAERMMSGGRKEPKPSRGEYRILEVPTTKHGAVHGRGHRTKTVAFAEGVVPMEVQPGRRVFLVEAPEEDAPSFQRMINRVLRVASTESPAAVERALDNATQAVEPIVETWRETEAARWTEIREAWLQKHPALTAAAIARLVGSGTVNPSALLKGWVDAKRVFSVQHGKQRLYPEFQIGQDGQPKPVFRMLLTALEGKLEGWPLAIWLTRPNAEFDDWKTPLDVIERAPHAVVAAAQHEVAEASY
ncbi:hypothetical protein JMJ55_28995 [Belnapia sp. T6]|uniref:DUF2384 domain-containing protein n=1 Tax=Belnapia mucosa TaxID=2804532 RepID=A0ABS1VCE2_9PROT|nr:hypothetical protein [Belnapia mucosa]MBL6459360.1 hypothetical protein [Belnapia mucosa]